MLRRVLFAAAGLVAASAATYLFAVRPWWRSWGVDPAEAGRALPGDELVPDALISDTRAITIEAPAEAVWPWLPQMGFGRAGWYSYDRMDMAGRSAERILPEFQGLEVGDILPAWPGGGFVVRVLEPGRALVLYIDGELVAEQATVAQGLGEASAAGPANLRAAGSFMGAATPPDFKASWAVVVEPADEGRSRLIERCRIAWTPAQGEAASSRAAQRALTPLMAFGIFAMARKQLLGVRDRAERLAREGGSGAAGGSERPAATAAMAGGTALTETPLQGAPAEGTEPVAI